MKQTYYILALDAYNQPNGDIMPRTLTEQEYIDYKKINPYIYADYVEALYRALD